ncbi:hypothetical protein F5Y15DRAFT_419022 [Xylariaceae sp. FL0016]|nr:hypothetical protein F5Y15DRAFT_419022 [Xylariaceae sp. FL0016]
MDIETWVVVGASRGIGLEFVKQLLEAGHHVIAAVRRVAAASKLFDLIESQKSGDRCFVKQCDISKDESITQFCHKIEEALSRGMKLGNVILNAGMLKYPSRATETYVLDTEDSARYLC